MSLRLCGVVCALSSVVCALSSVVCALSSVVCALSSVVCALSSVVCALSSVVCALSSVVCALSSVVCALSSVMCALSSVVCALSTLMYSFNFFHFRAVEKALDVNQNILSPGGYERKAPIYDPQKLICVGMNYRDHCLEQNMPVPTEPIIFSKFSSSITDPYGAVELLDIVKVSPLQSLMPPSSTGWGWVRLKLHSMATSFPNIYFPLSVLPAHAQ